MLITTLSFLIVLGVIILVHELGHFVTAKVFKVKVLEFGMGYPPKIAGVKRGETVYSLNALPLGGFIKMAGEEDPTVSGSLASKSVPARIVILGAGAFMNAVLPIVLLSLAIIVPHEVLTGRIVVEKVAELSPAEASGFRPGDTVLTVNGKRIENLGELQRSIQLNLGREITVLLQDSSGTQKEVSVKPRWKPPKGQGAIGVVLKTEDYKFVTESYPFWQAIPKGFIETVEAYILLRNGLISMIIGAVPVQFGGPVAIAQVTGEAARAGLSPLLEFAAFLSINLAILNLLPFPALDGGRIVFVIMEWIRRGKRISPKTEGLVHLIGFVTLMALLALITFTDILRIIRGGSLIP